jgi:predicted outer membrane protein
VLCFHAYVRFERKDAMTRVTTFLGLLLVAGFVIAQQADRQPAAQRDPTARPAAPARDAEAPRETTSQRPWDRLMIQCLTTANKGEIAISKFAQRTSQNKEVQSFAAQMVKDHSGFLSKLQEFDTGAGARPAETPRGTTERESGAEPAPDATDPASPRAQRVKGRREAREAREERREERRESVAENRETIRSARGGGLVEKLIEINEEIGERCLATAERELEQKEGTDFDRCYIGMQVGAHLKMVDELSVFKNHASPNLQPLISQGLETSTQHLAHAKKLMQQLEKSGGAATARREGAKQE